MARRLFAACFAAATLGLLGAGSAAAQVSPPTSGAVSPTSAVQAAPLSRTGSDSVPVALIGAGLAVAGVGVVAVARTRQSPAPA